jgi:dihydroflavonol-4-reductase
MRILVTGADGFLGSNLVRLLLKRGYKVSVLLHPGYTSGNLDGLALERHPGDILDRSSIMLAMAGCDAVIHAAAMTEVWPARNEQIRRVNVEGTQNIIEAVLVAGIPRMVYVGSCSSVDLPTYPNPGFGLDYIDSKRAALQSVLNAVATKKLPAVVVLPTFMVGSYCSPLNAGKMIWAVATNRLKFYTHGGRNFVHVKDVAVAIANALTVGKIGKSYIAGNENLSYNAFFTLVAKVVDQPTPRYKVPDWLVISLGRLGDLTGRVLHRAPLISYPVARIACIDQYVDCQEALRDLQIPSTPIETAVRDCYDYFMEKGILPRKTVNPV